eukprot:9754728-Alexandrium_andersonii.AAC.1
MAASTRTAAVVPTAWAPLARWAPRSLMCVATATLPPRALMGGAPQEGSGGRTVRESHGLPWRRSGAHVSK